MSANVLLFNDLQFSMEDREQAINRADRSSALFFGDLIKSNKEDANSLALRSGKMSIPLPLYEAPVMFRNGEFREIECITDSPIIADTAAELGYEMVIPRSDESLFFVLSTDIPVLF